MIVLRTFLGRFLTAAALIFASTAYSAPLQIREINGAILASPILREHCHPELNELCFWQPDVFILGYSKKKGLVATIQLTPENTESGSTVYQLTILKPGSNKKKYNKRYEFKENQKPPFNPDAAYSDINAFWEMKRDKILQILTRYGINNNSIKQYKFTNKINKSSAYSNRKIHAYINSYECKVCTMPIIAHAVVGYLQLSGNAFAVICFLEKGVTGGPAVAHVELVGI